MRKYSMLVVEIITFYTYMTYMIATYLLRVYPLSSYSVFVTFYDVYVNKYIDHRITYYIIDLAIIRREENMYEDKN